MDSNSSISFEEAFYLKGLRLLPLKVAIDLLNVLLNTVALVVFSQLKRTFSNSLFISLTLSDLLIGLIFTPLYIVNTTVLYWPFGHFAVVSCIFYQIFSMSQWLPSVFTILLLAIHRFRQLYWPTSVNEKVTRRKILAIVAIWVLPYVANTARFIVYYNQGYVDVSMCFVAVPIVQFVINSALTSVLPVLVSLFFNLANVFGLVRRSLKQRKTKVRSTPMPTSVVDQNHDWSVTGYSRTLGSIQVLKDQKSRRQRRQTKASICIGAIILNNLITQYPFTFLWPIETICNWCVPGVFFDAALIMLLVSPVINPLLLFVFHDLFQKKFVGILSHLSSCVLKPRVT